MAKKRAKTSRSKSDNSLMLLAAAAALIVGFFAVLTYKSQSVMLLAPTPNPTMAVVNLEAQNNSYESGTATLTEVNGKVVVTVALTGFTKGVTQPAHIHIGSCPNPGAIKYPLSSVINGQSVTTINTTLADLKAMGPLALNVHKSVSQSSVYYSCGDLKL